MICGGGFLGAHHGRPVPGRSLRARSRAPIPQDPDADVPGFVGSAATLDPTAGVDVPRHPFMAPNGRSNLHNDAYQTDSYRWAGPARLRGSASTSALFFRECASITFDSHGRLVSDLRGAGQARAGDAPARHPAGRWRPWTCRRANRGSPNPFQDFSGGGYFYLDNHDRAVISAGTRHILVVAETGGTGDPGFAVERDYDVSSAVPRGRRADLRASGLVRPDLVRQPRRRGRDRRTARAAQVRSVDTGEPIGNSFAVDETGGVLHRHRRGACTASMLRRAGRVVTWRADLPEHRHHEAGPDQAGSGTTPTLLGKRYVAITDNADPMAVARVRPSAAGDRAPRLVCRQPVFEKGASATDQSLIAARHSLIAENNYGYTGPASTMNGAVTSPGVERVDLERRRARLSLRVEEPRPSTFGGAEAVAGRRARVHVHEAQAKRYDRRLVPDGARLRHRARPCTAVWPGPGSGSTTTTRRSRISPNGTAYVGVLGGLTRFRDAAP